MDIKTIEQFVSSRVWQAKQEPHPKISDEEVVVMKKIIHLYPGCRFLQIGTKFGYMAFSILYDICSVGGFVDTVDFNWTKSPKKKKMSKIWNGHVGGMIKKHKLHKWMRLHTQGSDIFFRDICEHNYDIIFIDGGHSFDRSNCDLHNSIKVLDNNGTIVMHDIRSSDFLGGSRSGCYRTFYEFNDSRFNKHIIYSKYVLGIITSQYVVSKIGECC